MPRLACLSNRQVLHVVEAEFLVCPCGGEKDAVAKHLLWSETSMKVGLWPAYLGVEISGRRRGGSLPPEAAAKRESELPLYSS